MRQLLPWLFRNEAAAASGSSATFASIDRAVLVEDPYPHLVAEDALPRAIADTLLAEMPPLEVFLRGAPPGSNVRFPLRSSRVLSDPSISDAWKDALRACLDATQDFLDRTLHRLGAHLLEAFPDFEARFGPLETLRAVPRHGPIGRNEVGMDAQMVVNSPPLVDDTRVRGPHLDLPNKLISALIYLRPDIAGDMAEDLFQIPRVAPGASCSIRNL